MRARSSKALKAVMLACAFITAGVGSFEPAFAQDAPAKQVFGHIALPSASAPASYGSYAKGCQSGAVAMPVDGPGWQAMRLSRNRRWGQPQLIALLERFSQDAKTIGWPGLLLGDISQPRGGPMLSGHASHQIGLDADIWFTPMPSRTLSAQERETMPFTSMLDKSKFLTVDPQRWNTTRAKLVMMAASYPQVERIFVNPAIKQKMCETWTGDRTFMGKIRPIYGHDEHFHIRIKCPAGALGCKPQAAVPPGDGCDKSLAYWFTKAPWAAPKKDPTAKPVVPRPMMVSDLPKACAAIAQAPSANIAGFSSAPSAYAPPAAAQPDIQPSIGSGGGPVPPASVPMPGRRPLSN